MAFLIFKEVIFLRSRVILFIVSPNIPIIRYIGFVKITHEYTNNPFLDLAKLYTFKKNSWIILPAENLYPLHDSESNKV